MSQHLKSREPARLFHLRTIMTEKDTMTRVDLCSDLHLEFCPSPNLPGGDILLLAGDIFQISLLGSQRTDKEARKARSQAIKFCANELGKYQSVLYVPGNHEFWKSTIDDAVPKLQEFLSEHAPNVILLDNQVTTIAGVTFIGTTLWARSCTGTADEWLAANAMRDFDRIRTTAVPANTDVMYRLRTGSHSRAFMPADAHRLCEQNKTFIRDVASQTTNSIVLITHHAPSFKSGHGIDENRAWMDDIYCADLVDICLEYPHIKYAVHGHTHYPEDYLIGATRVLSNPRGYFPMERLSLHFDPHRCGFTLEELR